MKERASSPNKMGNLGKFPQEFFRTIITEIKPYSTLLLGVKDTGRGQILPFRASGTFVRSGNLFCILTANHFCSDLRGCDYLGLVIHKEEHQFMIRRSDLHIIDVAVPAVQGRDPDISIIVILSSEKLGTIGASQKTFYNLDRYRDGVLNDLWPAEKGVWVVVGYPEAKREEIYTPYAGGLQLILLSQEMYAFGGLARESQLKDFDLLELDVEESCENIPNTLVGISGGGIWQIPVIEQGSEIRFNPPLLSGMAFSEERQAGSLKTVRCHGRMSLYRKVFEKLQEFKH